MQDPSKQTQAVIDHFGKASTNWGDPYSGQIRDISDFDLAIRRTTALSILDRIQTGIAGPQDLLDVAKLLRVHPGLVDRVRGVAEKYGVWAQLERWTNDPRVR